jgi:hypothetical protein
MAVLYSGFSPENIQVVEERFYTDLANKIPDNMSVGFAYAKEIQFVDTTSEIPLSPRMARLKKAGLLGCFDGTGVTSENYKEILHESYLKKKI